jgi:hypothetical protein
MIIFGIILIAILILIIWAAYYFTAAYQQTLIIESELDQTYRYVSTLHQHRRYRLDSIRIEVTGKLKTDSATIAPSDQIQALIQEHIIDPYRYCLLIHEPSLFDVDVELLASPDTSQPLRRCPLVKAPTLENLSIILFQKLVHLVPRVGAELVSVELRSGPIKVSHSRYKISNFTM